MRQTTHQFGVITYVPAPELKTRLSAFVALREKLQLSSAHPELHKTIYVLCLPSLLVIANAMFYYFLHGEASLPEPSSATAWTTGTYAASPVSLIANIAATVMFVIFSRHRSVPSHCKIAVSFMLTLAWLGTFLSFLVVD